MKMAPWMLCTDDFICQFQFFFPQWIIDKVFNETILCYLVGWRFQDQEVHTQEQIWGSGKLLSNSQIFICIIKGHISNANNLLSWFLTWNDQAGPKQNCNSMIHAAKRKVIISWVLPYYLVIIFSGMTMSGSRSFFDMDTGWRRKKAWLTHWRKSNFSRYMVILNSPPSLQSSIHKSEYWFVNSTKPSKILFSIHWGW